MTAFLSLCPAADARHEAVARPAVAVEVVDRLVPGPRGAVAAQRDLGFAGFGQGARQRH
jgi:hypothetical protein